jgi:hypothetical protein
MILEEFRAYNVTGLLNLPPSGGSNQGAAGQNLVTSNTRVRNGTVDTTTGNLVNTGSISSGPYAGASYLTNVIIDNVRVIRAGLGATVSNIAGRFELRNMVWEAPALTAGSYGLSATGCPGLLVEGGDWSGLPRAFALTACPGFAFRRVDITSLADAGNVVLQDRGGNNGGLFQGNLYGTMTPALTTSGTPSTGIVTDFAPPGAAGIPSPNVNGLAAWSVDPASASSSSANPAAGTAQVAGIDVAAGTVSSIWMYVAGAGSGLTTGQCFAAIYQGGALLGATADQSTAWQSTGAKQMALTAPVTVAAGEVQVIFWSNGTTQPTFNRAGSGGSVNLGVSGATARFGTANTGLTTAAPSTLGTVSTASTAIAWLIGLS